MVSLLTVAKTCCIASTLVQDLWKVSWSTHRMLCRPLHAFLDLQHTSGAAYSVWNASHFPQWIYPHQPLDFLFPSYDNAAQVTSISKFMSIPTLHVDNSCNTSELLRLNHSPDMTGDNDLALLFVFKYSFISIFHLKCELWDVDIGHFPRLPTIRC